MYIIFFLKLYLKIILKMFTLQQFVCVNDHHRNISPLYIYIYIYINYSLINRKHMTNAHYHSL